MATKRFTNLQQIGPIVAEVDANGDAIFPSSASGGTASQVEGTQAAGSADQPNPVVIGYRDVNGNVAAFNDDADSGAPAVSVLNGDIRISDSFRSSSTFTAAQTDVLTSVTKIINSVGPRGRIVVTNNDSTNPIYIGHTSGVTTSTGYRVGPGQSFELPCDLLMNTNNIEAWAIATGATVRISILQQFFNG